MRIEREDPGHQKIATFDIETTHWKPSRGEIVSLGVAIHDRESPLVDADIHLTHREPGFSEVDVVKRSYEILAESGADFTVSFNGKDFDLDFIDKRLAAKGGDVSKPDLLSDDAHLDLLHDDRKARANRSNQKYPSLEEALSSYGFDPEPQLWRGRPLTNVRFGDELGPAYLDAISNNELNEDLRQVIDSYLADDLLKNLRLYYFDIGLIDPLTGD